jgi:hypothetical protein
VASVLALVSATPALADHNHGRYSATSCPAPESLVTGTTWQHHRLAPGVTLAEGKRSDRHGFVDMHVLDVDVTNKHVAVAPLAHRLAQRSELSVLAAGQHGLTAATNTGYFDFDAGAPLGPLVDRRQAWVTSSTKDEVVGLGSTGLVQAGKLALSGTVTVGRTATPLAGLNVLTPTAGLTAYTSRWGSERVELPRSAVSRYVAGGRVSSTPGRYDAAPSGSGYLLVARGTSATAWLSGLAQHARVTVTTKVTSDTTAPFTQAYGVGARLVHDGTVGTTFTCRQRYPQPARTAIGFANHGKRLLLVVVADLPGAPMHGLDSAQMARLMHDLGATEAFLFDGSGSSEMLARMPANRSRLSMRNLPADGTERPMPVGLGVFRR